MIKLLIDVLLGVPAWLLSQLPTLTLPAFLTGTGSGTLVGAITTVSSSAGSLSGWVPIHAALTALAFVMTCWGLALAIKLLRIVVGYLPGFGGSQS